MSGVSFCCFTFVPNYLPINLTRKVKNEDLNRLTVEKYRTVSKTPLIVVLDNIRSMHNVGAIFRTSDAFRVEKIYLCGITATPPHRDIRKTALGAEESVAWEYTKTTAEALTQLKDCHICALEQVVNSVPLREVKLPQDKTIVLIVGNEVDGVDENLLDSCNQVIEIPQFGTKHSFNVSVSTGITLWEIFNKINE
jgi:23S rRNA (guanosine2251-2'-O)-methyltransferase|tara:strand:+ start:829 stop:1413 length:585 start_codon:yes stop_codon:yes gene_type:complete